MAKTYRITPVDELPGRRATSQQSVYLDVLDEATKSASKFMKVEIPGRKPASITAGLKEAIRRDQKRFGSFAVHQRAGQVFLEKRGAALRAA